MIFKTKRKKNHSSYKLIKKFSLSLSTSKLLLLDYYDYYLANLQPKETGFAKLAEKNTLSFILLFSVKSHDRRRISDKIIITLIIAIFYISKHSLKLQVKFFYEKYKYTLIKTHCSGQSSSNRVRHSELHFKISSLI